MAATKTDISWTDATWNPTRGCSRVSRGCEHCYAEKQAARSDKPDGAYEGTTKETTKGRVWNGEIKLVEKDLLVPRLNRVPKRYFVNSMSDLFHERIPFEFIQRVFSVMRAAHWHDFQVLTKRPERLAELAPRLDWPSNAWAGVTIEDDEFAWRADMLRETGAALRFVSAEPLLGPLPSLDLSGIGWVIVGGESGPRYRPCKVAWMREVEAKCDAACVPLFVKQDSARRDGQQGDIPGDLWARKEFPRAHPSVRAGLIRTASSPDNLMLDPVVVERGSIV